MTDNLKYWEQFADIDPKFTKQITGKQYKGTSPNPQYVIRCLTEMFGPIGHGFGWHVVREDFTPIGEEVLHWCRIWFWTANKENGFEGYGQTKALMKTRNGMMMDEDAPKKSMTDAAIKAASQLGVAANIFLGRWDDQKYVQTVAQEYAKKEAEANQPDPQERFDRMDAALKGAQSLEALHKLWGSKNFANAYQALSQQMQSDLKVTYDGMTEDLS